MRLRSRHTDLEWLTSLKRRSQFVLNLVIVCVIVSCTQRDAVAQPASVSTLPPATAYQGPAGSYAISPYGVVPTLPQPGLPGSVVAPANNGISMPPHVPLGNVQTGVPQAGNPALANPAFGSPSVAAPNTNPGTYFPPGVTTLPPNNGQLIAPAVTQPYNGGVNPNAVSPNAIAPGATGGYVLPPAPGGLPYSGNGGLPVYNIQPSDRILPIDVYVQEGRTGRVILGGTVNSDLGVAGKVIIEERNFDFRQLTPDSRFLRGGRQHLRLEAMPGNEVQRYAAAWTQPNLFGYLPYSLSVGGFYYTRELRDWHEQRGGGRVALGFDDNRGFSISSELRMEDVKLFRPRVLGVDELDSALGSNDVYRVRFRVARDTRDSPFLTSEGGLLELMFDQVFGEYDYPRGQITWLRHFPIGRPIDPTAGTQNITHSWKIGISGAQTPIFENFYAGGYSTLRGFEFRGASPKVGDVEVGGQLSLLGSLEYSAPITADDMLRGVAFVDYGTVEQDFEVSADNFRVSLGLGLRVFVPAVSPAPFAFDFAYPVTMADTDERRIFNFFVGATR